jgi:predicted DCC family thiol-disulfide oxidoreductase YuxK
MTAGTDTEADVPSDATVVLFDGVCNLCNGLVSFLIPRDPDGRLRFAALQSDAGQELLTRHGLPTDGFDSFVLVEGEQLYTKSDAAIRVAELLGWPYRAARVGRLVPRGLRDSIYDIVADNRYDWFGRKDQCMIPDEDVSDRFL